MKKFKNCLLCNTEDKSKTNQFCSDCKKIKNHIRSYGMNSILSFINRDNIEPQSVNPIIIPTQYAHKASAPPY